MDAGDLQASFVHLRQLDVPGKPLTREEQLEWLRGEGMIGDDEEGTTDSPIVYQMRASNLTQLARNVKAAAADRVLEGKKQQLKFEASVRQRRRQRCQC